MSKKEVKLKLGTTLYALTNEFHSREYSFEELVREVAARKLGPGLEVVGFQSIRNFPVISDEFAAEFRDLIAETGLRPSCLGINADRSIRRDYDMSDEELYQYHIPQIQAAAKLGFPVVRYQYPAGTEVIRRLAPLAEDLDVKLGMEIHAPHHVDHPDVLAYREMYDQVGSGYLGFIPDFGASARTVPPGFLRYFLSSGIPQDLIDLAMRIWHEDGDPVERRNRFSKEAEQLGALERHKADLYIIFGLFSRQPAAKWQDIMHQVVHIHGKFFEFDKNGEEEAVDYEALLPVFVNGGYDGYMSSEWEGHMWSDDSGLERVQGHHKLCSRILAGL